VDVFGGQPGIWCEKEEVLRLGRHLFIEADGPIGVPGDDRQGPTP
jgi:hypothetical protein